MQEIPFSHFERVKPFFAHIEFLRSPVFSVLEGTQAGRVFVDRMDDPGAAVMISDFCYFSGSPEALDLQPEVIGLLEREAMPGRQYILIYPLTQPWHAALEAVFQPYEMKWYERITFELDPQRYHELQAGWRERIPAGFSLRRLDAAAALEVGGIPELWGTVENFLANGFGYCLFDETRPDARSGFASSAQTVFVGDRHAETGVGTRETFRRKGLATAVCCAYIEHCLESGLVPDWGCVLNEASERLASRLGFGSRRSWPLLFVRTPEQLRNKG